MPPGSRGNHPAENCLYDYGQLRNGRLQPLFIPCEHPSLTALLSAALPTPPLAGQLEPRRTLQYAGVFLVLERCVRPAVFGTVIGNGVGTMLQRYTLKQEDKGWALKDQEGGVITTFKSKSDATTGGQLEKAIGAKGGTVRIHKDDGTFEEERTYPRAADPRDHPG